MGIASLIIIICNFLFSYRGFKNIGFYEQYVFEVDKVLIHKEYIRLVSSGFLHVSWFHLIFNMISLYVFSSIIENALGIFLFLLIYFGGLIGGNLLSLFFHKNEGDYRAVGASGAVNAIIFAAIILFPQLKVGFFILPISIPGWIYGFIYMLYTIYGIRARYGNIGHDAHLGGALTGILIALLVYPDAVVENTLTVVLITLPILVFFYITIKRPYLQLTSSRRQQKYTLDQRYNLEKHQQQQEVDRILDKIHRKGFNSLNKEEKETLENYSRLK